jgi:polygalacturonase
VKDFGAKGCGTKVETAILQKAIDSCYNAGGGTVLFPSGKYLSATLVLKDNVGIYLSAGAQLIASDQKELYVVKTNILDTGSQSTPMLIYAKGAKNISIRGEGEIMAQPQYYKVPLSYSPQDFIAKEMLIATNAGVELTNWKWKDPNVTLIYLTECKDISISGVRLLHSAFWTLHVHWCERVNIDGIYIYSDLEKAVNADGIDIDGCKNVTITNCIIETADDAICMKTTKGTLGYRSCENIVVSNCILTSTSCALKLGTESYGDFRFINFSNCIIRNTNRGLGIFIRDGGVAENIVFSNIQMECTRKPVAWWGSGDALCFVVLKRNADSKIGAINNVVLKDIYARVEGTSTISGYPNMQNISNIKLENIQIEMFPEKVADKRATVGFIVNESKNIYFNRTKIESTYELKPIIDSTNSVNVKLNHFN